MHRISAAVALSYVQNFNSDSLTEPLILFPDFIEQMVLNMQRKDEISPTLQSIVNQFDEDNKRPLDTFPSLHKSGQQVEKDEETHNEEVDFDDNAFGGCDNWAFEHDEQNSVVDDVHVGADASLPSFHEVYAIEYTSIVFMNHE